MSIIDQIRRTEHDIKIYQDRVEKLHMIQKLMKNREFRRLILDGYLEKDCARNTRFSVDLRQPAKEREIALAMAQAAGYFKLWLTLTEQEGKDAERHLKESQELLETLRAEAMYSDDESLVETED